MIKKIVLFLIRKKLGVKKFQRFRFSNQKKKDVYFFTNDKLMKEVYPTFKWVPSRVGLNYLLSKGCKCDKDNVWIF